jgi:hypothetical protein
MVARQGLLFDSSRSRGERGPGLVRPNHRDTSVSKTNFNEKGSEQFLFYDNLHEACKKHMQKKDFTFSYCIQAILNQK